MILFLIKCVIAVFLGLSAIEDKKHYEVSYFKQVCITLLVVIFIFCVVVLNGSIHYLITYGIIGMFGFVLFYSLWRFTNTFGGVDAKFIILTMFTIPSLITSSPMIFFMCSLIITLCIAGGMMPTDVGKLSRLRREVCRQKQIPYVLHIFIAYCLSIIIENWYLIAQSAKLMAQVVIQ